MHRTKLITRRAGYCLSTAIVLATVAPGVLADPPDPILPDYPVPTEQKFLGGRGPLKICDQGSFFVGGVPKVTTHAEPLLGSEPRMISIGQMYVQFQIPHKFRRWPLIHVHGSTHSGAALEATPHGTEGWLSYGVRNNIATYVVDQSGRGRSGFDHSVIHEGEATGNMGLIPTFTNLSASRAWTLWFGHLIPEGMSDILNGTMVRHGDPGDPPADDATRHSNPNWPDPGYYFPTFPVGALSVPTDTTNTTPLVPYGPTPMGCSYQGGPLHQDCYKLHYYRQLLPNGEVTLPASTCAECSFDPLVPANTTPGVLIPANTWTPRNLAALVKRLGGAIVATHSQSGIMGHHMLRHLKATGDQDKLKALITVEGGCSLPNSGLAATDFAGIPYLAVKGDYTVHSPTCEASVMAIKAAGGIADYIELDNAAPTPWDTFPHPQILGVTHMMMLDKSNLAVMDVILDWVGAHVNNPPFRPRNFKCDP